MTDRAPAIIMATDLYPQVYSYEDYETGETYHWDTDQGDRELVGLLIARGIAPNTTLNPQEWAAGIIHDPALGPDPDPRALPRPAWMAPVFWAAVDKRKALALPWQACARPLLAVAHPRKPETSLLIDGWHRLYKAMSLGWTEIGVYDTGMAGCEMLRIHPPAGATSVPAEVARALGLR
jgi:hypothetical protein